MSSPILIIEEGPFSRVCAALLAEDGHTVQIVGAEATSLHRALSSDADSASLIVASYPVGHDVLKLLKGSKVPTIMLLNCIDRDMVHVLVESRNICCMVKPLDYRKFRLVVQDALAGSFRERGEVLVD